MAIKNSQINLYDHSEIKVRLLKLYLERYLSIIGLSSYFKDVHFMICFVERVSTMMVEKAVQL